MFGVIEGMFNGVVNTVDDFIDNPIGKTVQVATQPLRDGLEIIDGLTEGELRLAAATRLGIDVASGMALGELIDWYTE